MDFYNTLSKADQVPVVYISDHRLEYDEISHEHLDKLCEHKSFVDLGAGVCKTLIYVWLFSETTHMFGCEIDEQRYRLGEENLAKLHRYLKKNKVRTKFARHAGYITLSCSGRTLTYHLCSMYDSLVQQKVSEADSILANVGYYYRMRHKYKEIFKLVKPNARIISYKGPKFVDDHILLT